ncbi:MAG: response regulator transcription factor [Hyphomicrobiales bacterium]|nr:response regulator transcription factor [Hyphomicrobiales bacterium]
MSAIVHVVDDDASFRTSTDRLLRACGYVVESYESAEQLLKRLPDNTGVGCIVLDIKIPGLSGPELQNRLNALGMRLPIIFVSGFADVPTTVHVMRSGAEDLLTKPVAKEILVEAIERAHARSRTLLHRQEQLDLLRSLVRTLSPREGQVFERVVRGKINKEIARELGATERTIKAHRHRMMEKMRVTSLAELAIVAERLGVLASSEELTHRDQQRGQFG